MPKKEQVIKNTATYSAYIFIVWGLYRMLGKLPTEVEELIVKPIIWLVPLIYILKKERLGLSSLGITSKNLFPAIYFSLGLGVLFAIEGYVVNILKYKGIDYSADIGTNSIYFGLVISFATAVSEELAFRGYLFNRLRWVLKSEISATLLTTGLWMLIHLPISIFWWKFGFGENVGFLLLTGIYGVGSAFVFARTNNIISSILLHILWEWPIILFR